MASTATTRLGLRKQGTGDNEDTWGTELNDDMIDLADEAIAGVETVSLTGNKTLSSTAYVTNEARNAALRLTDGGLSAAPTVTIPAVEKTYVVHNTTTYIVTFSSGGTNATVPASRWALVYCDGTDVYARSLFQAEDQATYAGSYEYIFSTTTTDADPGSGFLRLDNATPASATGIYINDSEANGTSIAALMLTWDDSTSTIKGYIKIQSKTTPATFYVYSMSALTDNTGYMDFTVAYVAGAGTLANNDEVILSFSRSGDKGDTGATGATGTVSAAGDGTVSAPGIAWSADSNTGFYRKASGTTGYASDGTNTIDFGPTTTFRTGSEVKYLAAGSVSTDRSYDETTERDISLTVGADINIDFEAPNSGMAYSHVLWITQDGTGGRTITIRDGSNTEATWLGSEPSWIGLAASALTIVSVFYGPNGTLYAAEVTQ